MRTKVLPFGLVLGSGASAPARSRRVCRSMRSAAAGHRPPRRLGGGGCNWQLGVAGSKLTEPLDLLFFPVFGFFSYLLKTQLFNFLG